MRAIVTLAFLACATTAGAVGFNDDDDDAPPTPTKTTTECSEGQIWDADSETCVAPRESRLDDATLLAAAREFAHAGQFRHAKAALDAAEGQNDPRITTYRGFLARKTGDWPAAVELYRAVLEIDPDNLLARSYYGQGLFDIGDVEGAKAQLAEIRMRGGRDTWAYVALHATLRGTAGY